MPLSKTITDPDLGAIKLAKFKRAKNLRIKVNPDLRVVVTMPHWVAYSEAEKYFRKYKDWVQEQINKFKNDKPAILISPSVKAAQEAAVRKQAHGYLPFRLKELAAKHQLKYGRLSIRNTKTRWGSCSQDNNINLCMHLMKLPLELIDYVLLHELAHTVHKNHSERFWAKLSELLGENAKTIDKKLKKYRPDTNLV